VGVPGFLRSYGFLKRFGALRLAQHGEVVPGLDDPVLATGDDVVYIAAQMKDIYRSSTCVACTVYVCMYLLSM
jgi:hypothetical protein